MGRDCRDVSEEDWESAIVGYTTILDMTELLHQHAAIYLQYLTGNIICVFGCQKCDHPRHLFCRSRFFQWDCRKHSFSGCIA